MSLANSLREAKGGACPPFLRSYELCRENGLQNQKAMIYRSLLKEIICLNTDKSSYLDRPMWEKRLQTMFGSVITSDFFRESYRGKAFPVYTADGFGFLVWHIFKIGKNPIGAFLLFYPSSAEGQNGGLKLSLSNWARKDMHPAFIEFPVEFGTGTGTVKAIVHQAINGSETRELLSDLDTMMRPYPPENPEKDGLGTVWLPTALEGRVLQKGGIWFRICTLSPESGAIGLLIGKLGRKTSLSTGKFFLQAGLLLGLFWAAIMIRGLTGGGLPNLNIRSTLLLWFLGLAVVPLLLGFLAGASFLIDHEENLKDALVQDMRSTLNEIDSESTRLPREQEAILHNLIDEESIGRTMRDLQLSQDEKGLSKFKISLWNHCAELGLNLRALLAIGHHGFFSFRERLGVRPSISQGATEILRATWAESLGSPTPEISAIFTRSGYPKEGSSAIGTGSKINWSAGEGTRFSLPRSDNANFFLDNIPRKKGGGGKFFCIQNTLFGKSFATSMAAPVCLGKALWFILAFTWDQADAWLPRFAISWHSGVIASEAKQSPPFRDCFGAKRLAMTVSRLSA